MQDRIEELEKMNFEELKELQRKQQRFEATLAFATHKVWWKGERRELPAYEAVKWADELLEILDK